MSARTLLACLAVVAAAPAAAQSPEVSGTFVTTLGTDTVAIERYRRTGTKLEGEVLSRFPRVQVLRYVADLAPGRFTGMTISTRPVESDPGAPPLFSMSTIFADSVATTEVQRNGRPDSANSRRRSFRGRAAPSIPGAPAAVGLYEQILVLNQPVGRDSMILSILGAGPSGSAALAMIRRARDTVVFVSSFNPGWIEVATVDAGGRINSLDATATTVKTITRRASGVDFDASARAWAALEASRGRAGRMSPADTVRATVGTANLEIAYSRPFKRGRDIWGTVVKWNEPWRTGANAATHLTTSADLVFGTTVLPAGKYTLWSLPTPAGTKLIINTQTGQWGTQYDPARDLARLDMTQAMLTRPVEEFTITVVPQAAGGVLRMAWDNREYSIPFRVR